MLDLAATHDLKVYSPSTIAVFGLTTPRTMTPDDTIMQPQTVRAPGGGGHTRTYTHTHMHTRTYCTCTTNNTMQKEARTQSVFQTQLWPWHPRQTHFTLHRTQGRVIQGLSLLQSIPLTTASMGPGVVGHTRTHALHHATSVSATPTNASTSFTGSHTPPCATTQWKWVGYRIIYIYICKSDKPSIIIIIIYMQHWRS